MFSRIASFPAVGTMSVIVQPAFTITMDGSSPWKVNADKLKNVGGQWFLRMRAWDTGLIHLIANDFCELPKKTRFSLVSCEGWESLIKLRNASVTQLKAQSGMDSDKSDEAAQALFGSIDSNASKKNLKKPQMNAAQLKELREEPKLFDINVPGSSDRHALMVTVVHPAHPCDEMCVKLDADTIAHLAHYIREHGFDVESLTSRRVYASAGADNKGVWRNGSAGLVRKLQPIDSDDDTPPRRKYQSLNKQASASTDDSDRALQSDEPHALQDQEPPSGDA